MKSFYKFVKCLAVPALLLGAVSEANAARPLGEVDHFRYAHKAKGEVQFGNNVKMLSGKTTAARAIAPKMTLTGGSPYGFIEGPDESVWYYTTNLIAEEVEVPGFYEGYTQTIIKGFEFTIYDNNLKEVGSISDLVEFRADETQVASVMLDACVSKKFFNSDDNYEIIVSVAYNKDLNKNPYPPVSVRSFAYSLGSAKDDTGHNTPVMEIDGYVVSTVNAAKDAWSENFYITFLTESGNMDLDDHLAALESCKYTLSTYKKAGWGSQPELVSALDLPCVCLPGDQMDAPFFMSFLHEGEAWFALQRYQKSYFQDPAGMSDNEAPTEDNYLEITLYSLLGSKFVEEQHTSIPVVQSTEEQDLYTFYSVGNMGYTEDIDFGNFIEGSEKASFVITRQIYSAANDNDYRTSFFVYDGDGKQVRTIAENVIGVTPLTNLEGYEPQYMFVLLDETGEDYVFQFTDIYSGNIVASLPRVFEGYQMRGSVDRYYGKDSYMWGVSVNDVEIDTQGNAYEQVIWIDAAGGFLSHVDKINLGKDLAYATPYIASDAMSPYLFNTDSKREYMYLVKRYVGEGTETTEELVIASAGGNALMTLGADATKGALAGISLINADDNAQLCIHYRNGDKITQDIYALPFTKFEKGGDGSKTNPYIISTIGDLQQIKSDVNAHYLVANDIDASGEIFQPILDKNMNGFKGSLNGANYVISNLTIGTGDNVSALFALLGENAVVKDLNFCDVKLQLDKGVAYAGVIAGEVISASISDVHVKGLTVDDASNSCAFGGLVSYLALYSQIDQSSVRDADINLPYANLGGIAQTTTTSSKILACSFSGTINGGDEVGGIVGNASSAGDEIADCHVNATITAINHVGGIVGSSNRASIKRCYVEGSLEAIGPDKWDAACVGGIAGDLKASYAATEGEVVPVISNCIVNLSSIKGFETSEAPEYETQYTTKHRIVGKSKINENPYGDDLLPPEDALANNYAIASLPVDEASQPVGVASSVEGASVDKLDAQFFMGLGYAFGETLQAPWHACDDHVAVLFFEEFNISGVEDVVVDNVDIAVNDNELVADDCTITIYSINGVAVATGLNTVSTAELQKGIYIAVAVDTYGNKTSLKIVK